MAYNGGSYGGGGRGGGYGGSNGYDNGRDSYSRDNGYSRYFKNTCV
jgi:hypothetical protein